MSQANSSGKGRVKTGREIDDHVDALGNLFADELVKQVGAALIQAQVWRLPAERLSAISSPRVPASRRERIPEDRVWPVSLACTEDGRPSRSV